MKEMYWKGGADTRFGNEGEGGGYPKRRHRFTCQVSACKPETVSKIEVLFQLFFLSGLQISPGVK